MQEGERLGAAAAAGEDGEQRKRTHKAAGAGHRAAPRHVPQARWISSIL